MCCLQGVREGNPVAVQFEIFRPQNAIMAITHASLSIFRSEVVAAVTITGQLANFVGSCQKYGPKVRTSQETTNSVNFLMSV